jgi:membrane-associated protein
LFSMYNLVGGFLWITSFLFLGYLIGNIPIIKDNFGIVIGIIGVATTAPIIIAAIKSRFSKKKRLA